MTAPPDTRSTGPNSILVCNCSIVCCVGRGMNIALIFHYYSLFSDKKAQSNSLKNKSLAKQLNGFRLMIVNKKDKASDFWWEERKRLHCFNS